MSSKNDLLTSAVAADDLSGKYKWYAVGVASGSEKRVKVSIAEQAAKFNLSHLFQEVFVPIVELPGQQKKGTSAITSRNLMPGYVFVKMVLNDSSWPLIKSIPQVSKFIGPHAAPSEISEDEINRLVESMRSWKDDQNAYLVGDPVQIIDGPFESLNGTIAEVDERDSKLKVEVFILGRPSIVQLNFSQVKKKSGWTLSK